MVESGVPLLEFGIRFVCLQTKEHVSAATFVMRLGNCECDINSVYCVMAVSEAR